MDFYNTGPNNKIIIKVLAKRIRLYTIPCLQVTFVELRIVVCFFQRFYVIGFNGGQKCWDLSSEISKTSDPSPPTLSIVEF